MNDREFQDLLSDASRYIPDELKNIREKHIQGTLTEEEVNYLLKYAIPDMFLLRDIIEDLGLDYNDKNTYTKAMMFFMNERKLTRYALEVFWNSEEYKREIDKGFNNEELWRIFIRAAFSNDVYPLWSDQSDERRYKMLELPDYVYLLNLRRKAMHSEVLRRTEEVREIETKISVLPMLKPLDERSEELKPYETLKLSPARYECPFCHEICIDNEKLGEHLERVHGAS